MGRARRRRRVRVAPRLVCGIPRFADCGTLTPRLRSSAVAGGLLDRVNIAAQALMLIAVGTAQLGDSRDHRPHNLLRWLC